MYSTQSLLVWYSCMCTWSTILLLCNVQSISCVLSEPEPQLEQLINSEVVSNYATYLLGIGGVEAASTP